MIRVTAAALALLYLAVPSPGVAKGGPRTLSDYNIQKEYLTPKPRRGRYFNGVTARLSTGSRGARHYFPGITRYSTIRLERATSK
jgi:uncharacterized protein YqjF (DUF2071 family)